MKSLSKKVFSDQKGIHPSLGSHIPKLKNQYYQKPICLATSELIELAFLHFKKNAFSKSILDAGCGVGLSSYKLAIENPDIFILAVDKSESRLQRQNKFKLKAPKNLYYIQANLIDVWSILAKTEKFNFIKQYIFYPNPYPKLKHLKLRWYGHAAFPNLLKIAKKIEVRSNWCTYLEDFSFAANEFNFTSSITKLNLKENHISHFEKKYDESGHDLFVLKLQKKA